MYSGKVVSIALKRVFSKAIVLTIKPRLVVRECTASMGGLVVRTVVLGEPNITATYNFPRMQDLAVFGTSDFTIFPMKRVPGPPNMLYHWKRKRRSF